MDFFAGAAFCSRAGFFAGVDFFAGAAFAAADDFFAGAVFFAGAACFASADVVAVRAPGESVADPDVVARATADFTELTVARTAEPTLEVVDRDGASADAPGLPLAFVAAFVAADAGLFDAAPRAAVVLAAVPFAAVLPDAALLATIGPRPFVAHAVDVDKWGRQ